MIDILLVDDHKIVRDGLKFHFEDHDQYHIADEAADGIEALQKMEKKKFDVVITDISMPEMDGMQLVKEIKERDPAQLVIALTMMGESQHIKQMLAVGINGYLLKTSGEEEIIKAIDRVLDGENYFSKDVTESIMADLSGKKIKPKQRLTLETPLSDREKEVLRLIVDEMSNQEIADKLFISVRTVDAHKRNLLEKTGAKNVAGLVMYAVEHDLVG